MYKLKSNCDCVDEFAFGMMWGGKGARKLYVTNKDDVLLAVNKAYGDMSPRTIKNLGQIPFEEKANLRKKIAKSISDFFLNVNTTTSKDNFEKFHIEICDTFIKDFNSLCEKYTDVKKIEYGKAQKIVNMTFKYLYLFENSEDYKKSVFVNCHMAIDSYILKYFKKSTKENTKLYKRSCSNIKKGIFNKSWSNLTKEEYCYVQNIIEDFLTNVDATDFNALKNNNGIEFNPFAKMNSNEDKELFKFPFYAEFYIWDFQQTLETKNASKKY